MNDTEKKLLRHFFWLHGQPYRSWNSAIRQNTWGHRRMVVCQELWPRSLPKQSADWQAITEINQYSNLSVRYGLRKSYRRAVAFQFEFETKQKPISEEKKSLTIDEYVRLNPAKTKGKSELEVRKLMKQQPFS